MQPETTNSHTLLPHPSHLLVEEGALLRVAAVFVPRLRLAVVATRHLLSAGCAISMSVVPITTKTSFCLLPAPPPLYVVPTSLIHLSPTRPSAPAAPPPQASRPLPPHPLFGCYSRPTFDLMPCATSYPQPLFACCSNYSHLTFGLMPLCNLLCPPPPTCPLQPVTYPLLRLLPFSFDLRPSATCGSPLASPQAAACPSMP